jgi:hypothetical protein
MVAVLRSELQNAINAYPQLGGKVHFRRLNRGAGLEVTCCLDSPLVKPPSIHQVLLNLKKSITASNKPLSDVMDCHYYQLKIRRILHLFSNLRKSCATVESGKVDFGDLYCAIKSLVWSTRD